MRSVEGLHVLSASPRYFERPSLRPNDNNWAAEGAEMARLPSVGNPPTWSWWPLRMRTGNEANSDTRTSALTTPPGGELPAIHDWSEVHPCNQPSNIDMDVQFLLCCQIYLVLSSIKSTHWIILKLVKSSMITWNHLSWWIDMKYYFKNLNPWFVDILQIALRVAATEWNSFDARPVNILSGTHEYFTSTQVEAIELCCSLGKST